MVNYFPNFLVIPQIGIANHPRMGIRVGKFSLCFHRGRMAGAAEQRLFDYVLAYPSGRIDRPILHAHVSIGFSAAFYIAIVFYIAIAYTIMMEFIVSSCIFRVFQ